MGVARIVDFGQAGKRAVRFSYAPSEENIRSGREEIWGVFGEALTRLMPRILSFNS